MKADSTVRYLRYSNKPARTAKIRPAGPVGSAHHDLPEDRGLRGRHIGAGHRGLGIGPPAPPLVSHGALPACRKRPPDAFIDVRGLDNGNNAKEIDGPQTDGPQIDQVHGPQTKPVCGE